MAAPLALGPDVDTALATAERRARSLDGASHDLAGISRFLLRSEAIASSTIEGIAPSARQVALAELGQVEDVKGVSDQAQMVANNMTVVRDATTRLVAAQRLEVDGIVDLHRALLPHEERHHGIRTVQNWIGGSDWHPLDADFVPPAPHRVPDLMNDLVDYLNGAAHSPIAQAALAHAQFETIHPFTDGNGRVGRALIHTVLSRRGLVTDAVLPISLVLATLRSRYVGGLTAFRDEALPGAREAMAARAEWVAFFAEAAVLACDQAAHISTELEELRQRWEEAITTHRVSRGAQRALRSDSATAAILSDLPGTPVLTVQTVRRIHGVSRVAAGRALEELRDAGVLAPKGIGPGRVAFVANELLDLISWAERLASTRFDTRHSPPHSGAPAAPPARRSETS